MKCCEGQGLRTHATDTSMPSVRGAAADTALAPFRGQVRVATGTHDVLHRTTSIRMLCCVNPRVRELVLFDKDLVHVLTAPLECISVSVVCRLNDSNTRASRLLYILHVHVHVHVAGGSPIFYMACGSRRSAHEWASLLCLCRVPVSGVYKYIDIEGNQARSVMNGCKPLVHWIL